MTNHFNSLSEAEQERLTILMEECGEIVQAACKILLHGYESIDPRIDTPETNREALQRELGDLQHALLRMEKAGDVSESLIAEHRAAKAARVTRSLHHN